MYSFHLGLVYPSLPITDALVDSWLAKEKPSFHGIWRGTWEILWLQSFLFIDFEDPQLFSPQGPVQLFPGVENCLGIMSDAGGPEV